MDEMIEYCMYRAIDYSQPRDAKGNRPEVHCNVMMIDNELCLMIHHDQLPTNEHDMMMAKIDKKLNIRIFMKTERVWYGAISNYPIEAFIKQYYWGVDRTIDFFHKYKHDKAQVVKWGWDDRGWASWKGAVETVYDLDRLDEILSFNILGEPISGAVLWLRPCDRMSATGKKTKW